MQNKTHLILIIIAVILISSGAYYFTFHFKATGHDNAYRSVHQSYMKVHTKAFSNNVSLPDLEKFRNQIKITYDSLNILENKLKKINSSKHLIRRFSKYPATQSDNYRKFYTEIREDLLNLSGMLSTAVKNHSGQFRNHLKNNKLNDIGSVKGTINQYFGSLRTAQNFVSFLSNIDDERTKSNLVSIDESIETELKYSNKLIKLLSLNNS